MPAEWAKPYLKLVIGESRSMGAVGTVNGAVACEQVRTGAEVQRSAQGAFSIDVE